MEKRSEYFPQLTGIRAIAAFMVYIHHFNPFVEKYFPAFLHDYFKEFHIGVGIFFVLSGFLICYRYIDTFRISKPWFLRYLINRVARIYPMYFILTILTFAVEFYKGEYSSKTEWCEILLANLSFIRGFFEKIVFTGIGQGWTLTVEECFYFSAPLIFYIIRNFKIFWLQPLILIIMGLCVVWSVHHPAFWWFMVDKSFMMRFTFFGRCTEFYIGIKLALLVKSKQHDFQLHSVKYTLGGCAGIAMCILSFALLREKNPGIETGFQHPAGIAINNFILPVFVAVLFFGLLFELTWLRRILQTPLFILLGKSSYIFYLIHMGCIHDFIDPHHRLNFIRYCFTFISLNLISILLFKSIEDPLNKYIKKIMGNFFFGPTMSKDSTS